MTFFTKPCVHEKFLNLSVKGSSKNNFDVCRERHGPYGEAKTREHIRMEYETEEQLSPDGPCRRDPPGCGPFGRLLRCSLVAYLLSIRASLAP